MMTKYGIKNIIIGSSQHELAKWLAEILVPVLKLYSSHCVKDSFTFANFIQNCNLEPANSFLCSFDISSLFTNVPLDETIEICANALYRGHLDCPPFPEDTFRELMLIATRGVEFSFNNQMYKQLDGVAMGSPLGPALANIFVGFHESRLFDNTAKPGVYFRYVDDSFVIFGSELDCDHFQEKLNLVSFFFNLGRYSYWKSLEFKKQLRNMVGYDEMLRNIQVEGRQFFLIKKRVERLLLLQ